jgi:2-keto-4-pentenoate hydratase/2-oxohepta-3-ene-1,7-dioic acid hydratase in catechol pathway
VDTLIQKPSDNETIYLYQSRFGCPADHPEAMKLCTFLLPTPLGPTPRVGVVCEGTIVDATSSRVAWLERSLSREAALRVAQAQVPPDMVALIGSGRLALDWVEESVQLVLRTGQDTTAGGATTVYSDDEVKLVAPVPRPPGIACFVTWSAHIDDSRDKGYTMLNFPERGGDLRAYYKANPDAVEGPGTVIPRPNYATQTDVECEMAAVIGVGGKDLTDEEARAAIVGYTIFNDVSYREIQLREMAFGLGPTKGKDADGSNVLGPWLVTADEVGDPANLTMSFAVNDHTINSYNTSEMAWPFTDLAAYLSRGQTLRPGHILTSGSFPGGSALDAKIQLHSGDRITMRIEKLGALESTIG